jgi:hypothetical protein
MRSSLTNSGGVLSGHEIEFSGCFSRGGRGLADCGLDSPAVLRVNGFAALLQLAQLVRDIKKLVVDVLVVLLDLGELDLQAVDLFFL